MFIETRKHGGRKKYYLAHSFRDGKSINKIRKYLGSGLSESQIKERRKKAEAEINKEAEAYRHARKPEQIKESTWILGEDIPDVDLFFGQIWLSGFTNEFEWPTGKAYKKVMTVFKGYHLWFYFDDKDSYEVGEHTVNKFLAEPEFTNEVNREIVDEADKLREFCRKLPEEHLDRLSNSDLVNYYEAHDKIHTDYYRWCWIPAAVDMFHNNLTDTLKNYLKTKEVNGKLNEYFMILTQPTKESLIQQEQREFLEIAAKIQKDTYHKRLFKEMYRIFQEKDASPFGLKTHTPEYEQLLENEWTA